MNILCAKKLVGSKALYIFVPAPRSRKNIFSLNYDINTIYVTQLRTTFKCVFIFYLKLSYNVMSYSKLFFFACVML